MKKILFFLIIFFISSKIITVKASVTTTFRNQIKNEVMTTISVAQEEFKPTISEIREKKREKIKEKLNQSKDKKEINEIKNKIKEENRELLDKTKNQKREKPKNLNSEVRIEGKIVSMSYNLINIEDSNGKNYKVNITEKTQLRRKFWGSADLKEFTVGNQVKVIGRFINEDKYEIEAVLIRNLSIQRRWGVFFGEVQTLSENYLIIKTTNRGNLTVYFDNETKLKNRKEEEIKWREIQTGHKIRVKGVWDKDLSKIRSVEEIKDFSIPVVLTPTKQK